MRGNFDINTRYIVTAAVIAAIYAVMTCALAPFSYGAVQFRVSEAMTVLPFLMPEAIPGLFVGCLISNIYGAMAGATTVLDVVIGSLATLIAAYLTSKSRAVWLAPLAPVIVNAVMIGAMLSFVTAPGAALAAFPAFAGEIALSEVIICFGGGIPLALALRKIRGPVGA